MRKIAFLVHTAATVKLSSKLTDKDRYGGRERTVSRNFHEIRMDAYWGNRVNIPNK